MPWRAVTLPFRYHLKLRGNAEVDPQEVQGQPKPTAEQLAVAFSLASLIESETAESSFALFGAWGRGKSFTSETIIKNLAGDMLPVVFPSWLYPNKPECWVNLYRTVYESLKKENALALFTSIVRMNLERSGLYQAVGAVIYVMAWLFAFVPVTDAQFMWFLIGSIGPVALWFCFRLASTIPSMLRHVRRVYWRIESHTEKLGLQETIGRDLRDLIAAWSSKETKSLDQMLFILPVLFVFPFIALFLIARLSGIMDPIAEISARHLQLSAWSAFCVITFTLLIVVKGYRSKRSKVLVLVEDLDRVSADHSLAITESISVFLDNNSEKPSMHFLFLMDEDALDSAIQQRHGERGQNAPYYFKERLFKAHIRLPAMTAAEARATSAFIIEFDVMEKLLKSKEDRQNALTERKKNLDQALEHLERRKNSQIEDKYDVVREAYTKEVVVRKGLRSRFAASRFPLPEEAFLDDVRVEHIPAERRKRAPTAQELDEFETQKEKGIAAALESADNAQKAFDMLVKQLQQDDDSISQMKERLLHTDEGASRPRPISRIEDGERRRIAEIMGRFAEQKNTIWGPRSIISFIRKFEMMKTLWEYLVIRSPVRPLHDWEKALILDALAVELMSRLGGTMEAETDFDEALPEHREQARRLAGYVI